MYAPAHMPFEGIQRITVPSRWVSGGRRTQLRALGPAGDPPTLVKGGVGGVFQDKGMLGHSHGPHGERTAGLSYRNGALYQPGIRTA
jgi:hypothetical protein